MKLAVLFSGGKDSTYALNLVKQEHEVKFLITIIPEKDSWMFHFPCIKLTKLQAKALGIKHITARTKGEKEKELKDLKKAIKKIRNKVEGIVSGAVASNYQKSRIDKVCKEFGLKSIHPLWQKDQLSLLEEEISCMDILITGVFCEGFDESWLGRRMDKECLRDLIKLKKKYGINLSGEGGEYETFVLDSPAFKKKILIESWKNVWEGNSGYIVVEKAKLINKTI
jgi:ABC transporter with metal-binding/Fe-S-binding domain ATP-binding protein